MCMGILCVGIDVSKNKFDGIIKNEENEIIMKSRVYRQSRKDMVRIISDIKSNKKANDDVIIGLESSGKYHRNLMNFLIHNGFKVREFNPLEIKALRQGRIRKTKTDKIDAEVIANAVRWDLKTNTERYLTDENYLKMKELSSVHRGIVEKIADLKVDLRLALSSLCPGYDELFKNILSSTSIEILKKAVKQTKLFMISEKEIERILKSNYSRTTDTKKLAGTVKEIFETSTCPEYNKEPLVFEIKFILAQYEVLMTQRKRIEKRISRSIKEIDPVALSITGIGEITCSTILGNLGNVKRFKNDRAVTAYAGLDPIVVQSGKSINHAGHISKRGNRELRTALINSAMVGVMYNPVLKHMYHRLRSRGKSHWVSLVACARKLLLIIYSVEKNQKRFYVPDYIMKN
ncbi:MAG: IS110 family transposase [Candidatus Lokiarchaeota archaeon]|nr:IS110 family transposase [Candidatus Lokiarchaeota archaeon]